MKERRIERKKLEGINEKEEKKKNSDCKKEANERKRKKFKKEKEGKISKYYSELQFYSNILGWKKIS